MSVAIAGKRRKERRIMVPKQALRKTDIFRVWMSFVFIILVIFGVKGCIGSSRKSALYSAPTINLIEPVRSINGIPVYAGDVSIELLYADKESWKGFVEVVDDDTYKQEKQTFLSKVLAGRLFGGMLYDISSNIPKAMSSISWEELKRKNDTKYWIRAAALVDTIQYESGLDRILYSFFGRIVDVICGRLVDRKEVGTDNIFYVYNLGEFKPFYVSSLRSKDLSASIKHFTYLKLRGPFIKHYDLLELKLIEDDYDKIREALNGDIPQGYEIVKFEGKQILLKQDSDMVLDTYLKKWC